MLSWLIGSLPNRLSLRLSLCLISGVVDPSLADDGHADYEASEWMLVKVSLKHFCRAIAIEQISVMLKRLPLSMRPCFGDTLVSFSISFSHI